MINDNKEDRSDLIKELIKTTDDQLNDEELIHTLISQKMSVNDGKETHSTFGQRAADSVAKFTGSWAFIFSFFATILIWMFLNILLAAKSKAFDPYPFILLNLVLSCVAAVQAPLIMMSQNRQEEKDRERAENDYRVNLKNEIVIDDLHMKLDEIIENQEKIFSELDELKKENNLK